MSSISPSRASRLQEKEELKGLNTRLVNYIGRVKQLKQENHKLMAEVTTSKEVTIKEVDGIKEMYETELSDARKILDQTAKDKAREQLAASKSAAELDEAKEKLAAETAKRERAESDLDTAERAVASKDSAIQALLKDKQRALAKNTELAKENDQLKQALAETKSGLEDETLKRVDLENANQSLVEDLAFKQELYKQEIAELKDRIQTINTTTVTLETDYQREYDDRLGRALEEMKDKFEREADQYRVDVENTYKDQISNLKDQLKQENNSTTIYMREVHTLKDKVNQLNSKLEELEAQNDALNRRVQQLEDELKRERDQNADQVDRLRKMLRDTRKDLSDKIAEYEDLLDTKLTLDFEIMTYKKLLEDEEDRLQLSPKPKEGGPPAAEPSSSSSSPPPPRDSTDGSSAKRPRTDGGDEDTVTTNISSSSGSGLHVAVADVSGQFVKIANTTDQDQKFGGWKIVRVAEGNTLTYKFPPRYILRAKSTVTVWTGKHHQSKPPTDLVFKGKDSWGVGPETETELLNPDGESIAKVITSPNEEQGEPAPGSTTTTTTTRKILKPVRKASAADGSSCIVS